MSKKIWKPGTVLYPLPAIMVSCGNFESKKDLNIVTVAWTGIINTEPPMTYISLRPSRYSYDIIKNYNEFVINLTTANLAFQADFCGVKSGKNIDKFKHLNLTPQKSININAPCIAESPVNIECSVKEIKSLGTHDMFISEIVGVQVDDKYIDENNKFHFDKYDPICYSHGEYYTLGKYMGKFGYSVQKKKNRNNKSK